MIRGIIVFILVCLFLGNVGVLAESTLTVVNDIHDPTLKFQGYSDGIEIEGRLVGPGLPPVGYNEKSNLADLTDASAKILDGADVPAMTWSYGCSPTSATMLFGYLDRNGYPNMYVGPTNGGIFPLTNAAWGSSSEGNGQCPLTASQNGLDERTTKGHKDDYYFKYGSNTDPYLGSWTEHTPQDCIGDFMGTSMYQKYTSTDGSTWFWNHADGSPWYDPTEDDIHYRDGMHGMRLFAESRGYIVSTNYNQNIYGYNGNTKGFTYAQYKAEIDAGYPVLIQVKGHTMLGVGYSGTDQVIFHNTWDYNKHTMTWGGIYEGMQHYAVGVIHLDPVSVPAPTITNLNPDSVLQNSHSSPFPVIITGTGFDTVAATNNLTVDGGVVSYTINSPTQVTATFPETVDNTPGNHPVVVTGSGGSSVPYNFVVNNYTSAPTITALNPGSVDQNSKSSPFTVIITGTGFDTVAATNNLTVDGVVVSYTINSPTQITATFPETVDNTPGNHPVVVTGSGGSSVPYNFVVTPTVIVPTITNLNPGSVIQNSQASPFPVIIAGTGFETVAATNNVTVDGVVISYTINSPTQVTATFPETVDNTLGNHPVVVTGSGGSSVPYNFIVTSPVIVPQITNLDPASAILNSKSSPFSVTITGSGFDTVAGTNGVTVDGSGVLYTINSPTQITATFPEKIDNALGNHPVIVTGSGGPSNAYNFVVNTGITLDVKSDGIGWISPSGIFQVVSGSSQTFSFKPTAGAVIEKLTINGADIAYNSDMTYTLENIQQSYTVRLNNEPLPGIVIAAFNATLTGEYSVLFADASWGNPDTWKWDFGDGTSSTVNSVEHTYSNPGTYKVSLWTRNNLSQSQEVNGDIVVPAGSGIMETQYFGLV